MDNLLIKTLKTLDLSEKEEKLYLTSFKMGQAPIATVIKNAKLERSTGYLIAQELIKKGLLHEDFKQYRKILTPVAPRTLLRMVAAKERSIRRVEIELEEHLPEIEALYKTSRITPYVKVFQGEQALRTIWNDVLRTNNEIFLWTNQLTESQFFTKKYHKEFIAERIKKRLPIRVLAVNNNPGKALKKADEHALRQSKLLPLTTSFDSETYIYDNKVAMLDYKKDIMGIILESESIASTQKAIFEMTWSLME